MLLKAPREQKNFARFEKIFSHINFSLSQKQRHEQKQLSFRSALHFYSAPKSLQIFSCVSFPTSKITPIKLIKKGPLQYSSSSRKKDFSNTPLRGVIKRQRPNTIQIIGNVKKN